MAVRSLLRFEDTDQTRHKESGIEDQLNGLRWLGLSGTRAWISEVHTVLIVKWRDWIFIRRISINWFRTAMRTNAIARSRFGAGAAEQEASGEMGGYSGKCRNLTPEQIAAYQAEGR